MRALIYANSTEAENLISYFSEEEPYLLKIVNKPLLEYYLDLICLLGISEVRIVSDSGVKKLQNAVGDGGKWGLSISYGLARPQDNLQSVILKNNSFVKAHDLFIMDGFFFAHYDRQRLAQNPISPQACCFGSSKEIIVLPQGMKLKEIDPTPSVECFKISPIASIQDYYALSMEILSQKSAHYVLPGYTKHKEIFLGINLIYPRDSELRQAIMVGNNCRFQRKTLVGPNSIIGNNVIIDENTAVNDSIVYDNCYIGKNLDLDHKIVYREHIISAISGEFITITDKALVSYVEPGIVTSFLNRFTQKTIAFCLLILLFLPWLLLFLPYFILRARPKSDRIIDKALNLRSFCDLETLPLGLYGKLLWHLGLDKYDQIFYSLFSRRLYLVGNHLFVNSIQNRELVSELPAYNPGVFSLAETMQLSADDMPVFYELEYIDRVSTLVNINIFFKMLQKRLFKAYMASLPQKENA